MVNIRINEGKKPKHKRPLHSAAGFDRNVTGTHEKFPSDFVNFHLSSCSFSLRVHSGFLFPVASQGTGNAASHSLQHGPFPDHSCQAEWESP